MKKMQLFLLLIAIAACSPQQRLNRLVKKHPELVKHDTLRIIDTLLVPMVRLDTVLSERVFYQNIYDTIKLTHEKLTVQIWKHDSLIYIKGECAADTVIIERNVTTSFVQPVTTTKLPIWVWILVGISFTMLIFLILQRTS